MRGGAFGDFGSSTIHEEPNPGRVENATAEVGMVAYMAPEVANAWGEAAYDEKCDMWAFGVIACELLCEQLATDFSVEELRAKAVLSKGPCKPLALMADALLNTEPVLRDSAQLVLRRPLNPYVTLLCAVPGLGFEQYKMLFVDMRLP